MSFSENGFIFASGSSKEGVVKIWDLRSATVQTTLLEGEHFKMGSIAFDNSAQ